MGIKQGISGAIIRHGLVWSDSEHDKPYLGDMHDFYLPWGRSSLPRSCRMPQRLLLECCHSWMSTHRHEIWSPPPPPPPPHTHTHTHTHTHIILIWIVMNNDKSLMYQILVKSSWCYVIIKCLFLWIRYVWLLHEMTCISHKVNLSQLVTTWPQPAYYAWGAQFDGQVCCGAGLTHYACWHDT